MRGRERLIFFFLKSDNILFVNKLVELYEKY